MLKGERGFTLIEIITALSILTIGILSLVSLLTVGLASFGTSQDITIATLKAQQKLEETKRNGVNNLPAPPALPGKGIFSAPVQFSDNQRFSWQMAVSYVDDGSGTNTAVGDLREVNIRITWLRFRRTYSEDFTTYISKH
ncbi:MAG: prepilin-type N-terminal cleavage/methylation domain-containing protein [Candidatus Omnitrophica bacterium]|nr:prepilin-type N-terminal cleavage/methylation domain-containing protein [Candidatus Omnitrophota bacterium]